MARGDAHPYLLPILYAEKIILLHTLKIKIIIPLGTPRKWEFFFVVKNTTTLSVESLDYAISLC